MKKEYLAAYEFYKRQYHNNCILFHIGNKYLAFEEDVSTISRICRRFIWHKDYSWCEFLQEMLEDTCYKLSINNIPVTIVDYRNSFGVFDIPKVKQIMQDIEDDY